MGYFLAMAYLWNYQGGAGKQGSYHEKEKGRSRGARKKKNI